MLINKKTMSFIMKLLSKTKLNKKPIIYNPVAIKNEPVCVSFNL